ncbi:hypothetical protein C4J81_02580 [Deltaproteobacteria bacterium Smac51]|nr:hypothetical protein C4J81_02580 [Deltaproteobacteria bacterium Smac51]
MKHTILKPEDYRNMPWKNGLGTTCEILREPADDSQPFDWRISVADIKENGPFSIFSGYTRIINTLEGSGMRLMVDGVDSGDLKQYDPFVFSGDSQVESELIDGTIRDFNLIYRASVCKGRLQWLNVSGPRAFCSQADHIIIYAVKGIKVAAADFTAQLNDNHTLRVDNDEAALTAFRLTPARGDGDRFCCLIELSAGC